MNFYTIFILLSLISIVPTSFFLSEINDPKKKKEKRKRKSKNSMSVIGIVKGMNAIFMTVSPRELKRIYYM